MARSILRPRRPIQLKVLIAGWEREKLRQLARFQGVSVSDVVRMLIRDADSVGHGPRRKYKAVLQGVSPSMKEALLNGNWYVPRPRSRQP